MSQRIRSRRAAFASWCDVCLQRRKPRCHRTHLRFERLEERTVLAPFTPTIFDDGGLGSGSLRDAVLQANADPGSATITIMLKPGMYKLSFPNTNGQENDGNLGDLDINTNANVLIIQGGGIPGTKPGPTIIDAQRVDRAFQIFHNLNNTKVVFQNLTIIGGLAQDDGIEFRAPGTSDALGGAILSTDSTVILDHVIIWNNEALGGDGADAPDDAVGGNGFNARGGGVYVDGGAATLTDSNIRRNEAVGGNGGNGGAIGFQATDNIAEVGGDGGVAFGGGLFALRAQLTVTTSSIFLNRAIGGIAGDGGNGDFLAIGIGGDGGQGGDGFGGGLHAAGGTVTITSSNISKNDDIGGRGGEGGIGKTGGNGGQAGLAFGGGLFASSNDAFTLTDTDLLANFAQGGEGGGGHSGTATVHSGPSPTSGILGQGGFGGDGGAAWGGGLYVVNEAPIMVNGGLVNGNTAGGGHGGNAGHGADASPNAPTGGNGGNGGKGGLAEGGGIFIGAELEVDIDSTEVSENNANAGFGGAGGDGGEGDDDAGFGGAGGAGGNSRGGGLFFDLSPDTPVNLTSSPVLSNHALAGGGGSGEFGGSSDDDDGHDGGAGGTGGTAQGGGIFLGRAFDMGGNLSLTTSTLSSNEAIGGDGGHGADGGQGESGGNGGAGGAGGAGRGGGLFADGGTVTVDTSTISLNKAKGGSGDNGGRAGKATDESGAAGGGGGAGGAGQGGGVFASSATITMTKSTIDNNKATGAEGGKGGQGGKAGDDTGGDGGNGGTGGAGQGGGLFSLGSTMTLTNSTVSTNTARGGKGGNGGKGGESGDDDTDVSGNGGDGGNGGAVEGGGIFRSGGSLTLISDTIALNKVRPSTGGKGGQAGPGFGVGFDGSNGSGQAGTGGGVFNLNGTVDSFNTLIASNTAAKARDFAGMFNMAVHNLLGIGDGSNLMPANPDAQGNIVGSIASPIQPKLGPLTANNGGPTKTHALLVGSPAINKGDNASSPGTTDQRGAGFPRIVGDIIDIGAFEFQGRPGTK